MEAMKKLGLYLHIPFCLRKCNYCDFCSFPGRSQETVEAYVTRLCHDLAGARETVEGYTVDSVYIGGGTPTTLTQAQFEKIGQALHDSFSFADDCEFTVECNPATGSPELFATLRQIGVNRVSMGLQSIHEKELSALGRVHGVKEFDSTLEELLSAGFTNLSADLMFGIPHQSVESYLATLQRVVTLPLTHLSCYNLILEEGTPFWRMQKELPLPDEDAEREMYLAGADLLAEHGFLQYEISNFARRGYASRHNLKYWNLDPFLGFGLAAYSDFDGERFGNRRDLSAYLNGEDITAEREKLSRQDRANEYVMLRLRTADGLSMQILQEDYGAPFAKKIAAKLGNYIDSGLVRTTKEGYALTKEGFFVSNSILSDLLDFGKAT